MSEVSLANSLLDSRKVSEHGTSGLCAQERRNRLFMITRVTPLKRYKFTNTWPKSLEIGTIKAADAGVLTEKLVITHDRLSWSDALMRAYSGALNLAP